LAHMQTEIGQGIEDTCRIHGILGIDPSNPSSWIPLAERFQQPFAGPMPDALAYTPQIGPGTANPFGNFLDGQRHCNSLKRFQKDKHPFAPCQFFPKRLIKGIDVPSSSVRYAQCLMMGATVSPTTSSKASRTSPSSWGLKSRKPTRCFNAGCFLDSSSARSGTRANPNCAPL